MISGRFKQPVRKNPGTDATKQVFPRYGYIQTD